MGERIKLFWITLILLLLFGSKGYTYYGNEPKSGWWWYKDYVKEEKKEEEKKSKKEVKDNRKEEQKEKKIEEKEEARKKDEDIKPLTEYTYEELLKMPVEKFQKLFDYYKNLAISDPGNETNIYLFLNLVDVARKKSLLFMANTMNVLNKYPELDVKKDVPILNPVIRASAEMQREEELRALQFLKDEVGLVLFVRRGCPYCEVQKNIVNYLLAKGVAVKVIDIERDPWVVSRFGITTVPMLGFVLRRSGEFYPLGAGVISLSEIEARIAKVLAVVRGEKDPAQSFLYQYQVGTSLDPLNPPPLFRGKEQKDKNEKSENSLKEIKRR